MDDRRRFLVQCGLALATAGFGMDYLLDAVQAGRPVSGPAAAMTRDRFTMLLDQWMSFSDPASGKGMVARLIEVRDQPGTANLEQFSLQFRGRRGHRLPEGLYRVVTRSAGSFDLFIVPVRSAESTHEYRADFSLLV